MIQLQISAKDLVKILAKAERNPGKAQKTLCRFKKHLHYSKAEAAECDWHFARMKNKEILGYDWQFSVDLFVNGKPWKKWNIDFRIHENNGSFTYWERKGYNRSDRDFKLKRDAFCLCYPERRLYVNREIYDITAKKRGIKKSKGWRMADINRINKKRRAA